jgi:hypothetical protein
VQEQILEQNPSAELQVYAIWLPMLATDARSEWDSQLLADPRVTHFWDENRIVGLWFAKADLGGLGYAGIVWDAFFLYGGEARWGRVPGPLVRAGAPVISTSDRLDAAVRRILS